MSMINSTFGRRNILKILKRGDASVHFVGVGGVGMSSLYCLTRHFGIRATGVDASHGAYIDTLLSLGAEVSVGVGDLPKDTTLLVYSLAVSEDDPSIRLARERNIPIVSRAEYLGALSLCYGKRIAVSGTHGKSTVTAMLSRIFDFAGKAPTTVSGASLDIGGAAVRLGALDYLIYEACEYKNSFLSMPADVGVFLNLEYDHPDYFKDMDALISSFDKAISNTRKRVINADDENLAKIARKLDTPPVLVGKGEENDYRYKIISDKPHALKLSLSYRGEACGDIELSMIGVFNLTNAACAVSTAMECGISFDVCRKALSGFRGIGRRLEVLGVFEGRQVYYDYAHHPTEIKEGIKAIKSDTGGNVTLIFGAHTFSRTKALWNGFVSALSSADFLLLTEISGIREGKIAGIDAQTLAVAAGGEVVSPATLKEKIKNTKGAIVVMGAADMNWVVNFLFSG